MSKKYMNKALITCLICIIISLAACNPTGSVQPAPSSPPADTDQNGLYVEERTISVLDNPLMVSADQATWLEADAFVLGLERNEEARAYPVAQMAYHHIANDVIDGEPILVTPTQDVPDGGRLF